MTLSGICLSAGSGMPKSPVTWQHGKRFMPLVVSQDYIGMVRSIKQAPGSNDVLNPGKRLDRQPPSGQSA